MTNLELKRQAWNEAMAFAEHLVTITMQPVTVNSRWLRTKLRAARMTTRIPRFGTDTDLWPEAKIRATSHGAAKK